jgi:hypothetical protein
MAAIRTETASVPQSGTETSVSLCDAETAIHTELLCTLAKRFPNETPDQLQDRALRVIALADQLKGALSDFWAQNPR